VTIDGQLVRGDPASGGTAVVLPPVPEISSVYTPTVELNVCRAAVCYAPDQYGWALADGMILVFAGDHLSQPGWRVRIGGVDVVPTAISDKSAYIQVPSSTPQDTKTLEYYNPDYPMRWSLAIRMSGSFVAACFGMLHEDFSRLVSKDDPAVLGETVHTFLTGLRGVPPVPDGVPNPFSPLVPVANPPVVNPNAAKVLFFGLAPGLIGVQQLDMEILGVFTGGYFLNGAACAAPPVREH
jgi:uncharacterized protein (TIGR03437 family)